MEIIESEKANSVTPAESSSLASSDVENFTGKIVYNPDGSAYIIEGSDGSDVESEVGSIIPLNQEGSIVERCPAISASGTSKIGTNSSSSSLLSSSSSSLSSSS